MSVIWMPFDASDEVTDARMTSAAQGVARNDPWRSSRIQIKAACRTILRCRARRQPNDAKTNYVSSDVNSLITSPSVGLSSGRFSSMRRVNLARR
jgi:hypothetical protein